MKYRCLIPEEPPKEIPKLYEMKIRSDVLGSYTGLVNDVDDRPVQDADDL